MSKPITVQQRVAELVLQYGSYRAAGKATGVSFTYLNQLVTGAKSESGCTLETLCKLGLTVVVSGRTKEHAHRK